MSDALTVGASGPAPRFARLAVLGLGLLGGSVALAARARGVAAHAVGMARRAAPLEAALAAGVVDEAGGPADLPRLLRGADLVVLGTPVAAMARVLEEAAPHLAPGAIVTDVGSVKAQPVATLPALLPAGVHFVGSHPMAGSHRVGVEHARADLFEGRTVVVTPVASTDAGAAAKVEALWRALGARVVRRTPDAHDAEVAWTSHLPHVTAYAYALALGAAPRGAGELAATGFADFTRIAHSNPELWADILATNGKSLAGPIQRVADALGELARAVESGDAEALERLLAAARETLAEVAHAAPPQRLVPLREEARSGGPNPEIQAAPTSGRPPEESDPHS
ncbi:MAG: prephenate dehydrogenase [Myxococcota bacterium]